METTGQYGDGFDPLGTNGPSSRRVGSNESLTDIPEDSELASTTVGSPELPAKDGAPMLDFTPDEDVDRVPGMPRGDTESMKFEGDDEDPAVPVSFQRSSSPTAMHKKKGAAY